MSFYEVYTHVSEMHLSEIGLKTTWYEVDMNSTDKGQATWEGIIRRVSYRIPLTHVLLRANASTLFHSTGTYPAHTGCPYAN